MAGIRPNLTAVIISVLAFWLFLFYLLAPARRSKNLKIKDRIVLLDTGSFSSKIAGTANSKQLGSITTAFRI